MLFIRDTGSIGTVKRTYQDKNEGKSITERLGTFEMRFRVII